jgi:hypothetical protein
MAIRFALDYWEVDMDAKRVAAARDALLGFALSLLTMLAIGAVDRLPFSSTRDSIHDALTWPGGFVAGFFFPQGLHTGRGSVGWAYLAIALNLLIYSLAWCFLIRIVRKAKANGRWASP